MGLAVPVARVERDTAGGQRMPDRLAHVEPPAPRVLALHREPRRELARERPDCAAELRDLVARRAHELQVFGKRPDAVPRDGFGPAVLREAAPNFGVDLFAKGLHARLELVLPELALE